MYNKKETGKSSRTKLMVILVLALGIITASVVGLQGSLAWIADKSDTANNEFELEPITHEIIQEKSGSTLSSVSIKNTSDTKPSYIRATLVVNWNELDSNGDLTNAVYGLAPIEGTDYTLNWNTSDWVEYPVGSDIYYFNNSVDSGDTTAAFFTNFKQISSENQPDGYGLAVEVLVQSIQASGLDKNGNKPVELAWGVDIDNGSVKAATIN